MDNELSRIEEYDSEINPKMQEAIDVLGEHYMKQIAGLIENNRFDDADAIYKEFVVNGCDPEDGNYEWIFLDDMLDS
tara:strand:+ start:3409 stop:3639 length:231 start_codon:yes stop_codon:yes gene_type:complete